jgi:hypothetical protein
MKSLFEIAVAVVFMVSLLGIFRKLLGKLE